MDIHLLFLQYTMNNMTDFGIILKKNVKKDQILFKQFG